MFARQNRESPYRTPFGPRGLGWFPAKLRAIEDIVRDELLERFRHYAQQMTLFDQRLEQVRQAFPQIDALTDIHGIGLYSALLIVAEIGEAERFRTAKQVGADTGLTSRVHQSGGHCYQGSITRQGSPWLRWVLVQAAMKAVHRDVALKNFYGRIRKLSC